MVTHRAFSANVHKFSCMYIMQQISEFIDPRFNYTANMTQYRPLPYSILILKKECGSSQLLLSSSCCKKTVKEKKSQVMGGENYKFLSCSKYPFSNDNSNHQNHKGCIYIGRAQCCCIWIHCLNGKGFTSVTRGYGGRSLTSTGG